MSTMSEEYLKARKLGEREYRKAVAQGRYPYLPALDDIVEDVSSMQKVNLGHMEIPLAMIVGTKSASRQNAFSSNFMPLLQGYTEFAYKWERLYESQMEEGIREPIQVVEYLKKFYVVEGNKRVSIMNYVGIHSASANVTRLLPPKTDDPEIKLYYEFTEFFKVAPIYDVTFSKCGYYKEFAELLGQNLRDPWPQELLQKIRSALIFFERTFFAKGGKNLGIPTGDALLAYMRIYPLRSVAEESAAVIDKRLDRLWKEFVNEARSIDLVEAPEEEEKSVLPNPLRLFQKKYTPESPLKTAFIFERSPEHSSWLYGHMLGMNAIGDAFGGSVIAKPYKPETEEEGLRSVIDRAVDDGARIVFTLTSRQIDETLRCAIHFPQVQFLNCSVNLSHNAVRTYYARLYEAKFIMGALAAQTAENHKIGYIGDMPVYGSIANINAFAIGAQMIDPKAKIYLKWHMLSGSDPENELAEEGVNIISGRDFIRPDQACRKYGLYRVGEEGWIENIAVSVIDWGKYYERMLRQMIEHGLDVPTAQKSGQTVNYWWGMSAGVVDLISSPHLHYAASKLISVLKDGIISGQLSPFQGELHAQDRIISGEGGKALKASDVITMDWLNDNIIGEIPSARMMNEDAQETMNVIGVMPRR